MNTILFTLGLVVLALVGWALAELKSKALPFSNSEAEIKAQENALKAARDADFEEKGIRDVIATISTKGFDATK